MPRGKKKGTPARNKEAAEELVEDDRKGGTEQEVPDKKGRESKVVDLEWDCPHCDKPCCATVVRQTVTPATPAETKLLAVVRKDSQATLDLGGDEKGSGPVRVKAEKVK